MRRVLRSVVVAMLMAVAVVSDGSAASASGSDPIGSVDAASVRSGCSWVVSGWAMDPDNGSPVELRFFVDGREANTGGNTFYEPRPDVRAAHPNSTHDPGFYALVPAGCSARQICVRGVNAAGTPGSDRTVGCFALTSQVIAQDPIGHLDVAAVEPGRVVVNGWAADRDGEGSSQTGVHVRVDGQSWVNELVASRPRPDVAAVHPWSVRDVGFDQVLPVLPGRHQVCVYALNTGRRGNNNTTIGCALVDVPVTTATTGQPVGRYDEVVVRNVQGTAHENHGRGWAFDPEASGPVTVRVTTLGGFSGSGGVVSDVLGRTGVGREDVRRAVPGAGPDQGWDVGPILAGRGVAPRLTCATAVDAGPGSRGERLVGCLERIDSSDGPALRSHTF